MTLLLAIAACQRSTAERGGESGPAEPLAATDAARAIAVASQAPSAAAAGESSEEGELKGHFRGGASTSRVLFLADETMIHAWQDGSSERREVVTTTPPPGTRVCKVLRAHREQDFLLCMYWYTGPGGGRVDGVLFDLQKRESGEFFSAAINIQLTQTLCAPDTALGPMPSYTMAEWWTTDATESQGAEIHVKVRREGWSMPEARKLRAQAAVRKYCECAGSEACRGEPSPPVAEEEVVYRLHKGQLHPTKESEPTLKQIAAQWSHTQLGRAWNLRMRGYGGKP